VGGDPIRIDTHLHVYESKDQARARKGDYAITEYGPKPGVRFSELDGDVDDALLAMDRGGVRYAVAANIFAMDVDDEGFVETTPGNGTGAPRRHTPESARERLVAYNRWLCELAREHPRLIPFISLDPWALPGAEAAEHLGEMVESFGARGVKIHPNVQRFHASDRTMWPAYAACVELGVPVLSHTGPGQGGGDLAVPTSFEPALRRFPDLKLIMAHLGGGTWTQTEAIAREFPGVMFDLCEIIAWVGAPNAPDAEQLAALIRSVGPERVMMGSDFPWYDLDVTTDQVLRLPTLSDEEKLAILGGNAQRFLGIETGERTDAATPA
jgi:uncharacterized protein